MSTHAAADSPAAPLLISVHLPKTAGTSFARTLRAHYGPRLVEDYAMLPMQLPRGVRELRALRAGLAGASRLPADVQAIHGHFLPVKYRLALRGRRVRWITWLRDPVQRLLSHYHYWMRDYAGDDPAQPLRNRMLAERWSLERFCLGPELRNVYRQYLWGFDPARLAFIGITEHYPEDLGWFAQHCLGREAAAASALVNPDRDGNYPVASSLRARIERHHAADMALYRWALAMRETRLPGQPGDEGSRFHERNTREPSA